MTKASMRYNTDCKNEKIKTGGTFEVAVLYIAFSNRFETSNNFALEASSVFEGCLCCNQT